MRHIKLQSELAPPSLAKAKSSKKEIKWEDYSPTEEGRKLRNSKFIEQGGLCAYCECKLSDENGVLIDKKSHIDHFFPRNKGGKKYSKLTFEWNNLLLSCETQGKPLREQTCGRYKDNGKHKITAEQIISPHRQDPRDDITFELEKKDGRKVIAISLSNSILAANTIEALNLNQTKLCEKRANARRIIQAKVEELTKQFEKFIADEILRAEIKSDAQQLLTKIEGMPYCSSLLAYAELELKRIIESK